MGNEFNLAGRSGAARVLEVSEATIRNLMASGELSAAATVDGRPLFRIDDLRALKERRDAKRRKAA